MRGFEYPAEPHKRRHGPGGYRDYESYREWLRDDFTFRCAYCLHRERWSIGGGAFHIDHFKPVALDPNGKLEYANLIYACATCNTAKSYLQGVPNPCDIAFASCVQINDRGAVEPLNADGEMLVEILHLNSAMNIETRFRWMRTLAALRMQCPDLYREYMAFPTDLPDLRTKTVPQNSMSDSAIDCFFVLRELGKLPEIY